MIAQKILELIQTDDNSSSDRFLIEYFDKLDTPEKAAVDTCLTYICGYSLTTIMVLAKAHQQYTFEDLSPEAQDKAILAYIEGWKETHPDEELDRDEVRDILLDNDEAEYTQAGLYIGE